MNEDGSAGELAEEAPRVSVVLIVFNGERFIEEAIGSVLSQDFTSFELLLVNDGSTDASAGIAQGYAARHPARVRYMEHEGGRNRGAAASRNAGVAASRGALVAFIDADDVWRLDKLTEQVAIFDAHPELGMVAGATRYWRSWAGGTDNVVQVGHIQNRVIEPPDALLSTYPLADAEAPCPSCLMARKPVVESMGGFEASYTGALQLYEDQAFLTKLYLVAPVYFSDRCWLDYRQHDASCMSASNQAGHYHRVRQHFLAWFRNHLRTTGVSDRRIWRKVAGAQRRLSLARAKAFLAPVAVLARQYLPSSRLRFR